MLASVEPGEAKLEQTNHTDDQCRRWVTECDFTKAHFLPVFGVTPAAMSIPLASAEYWPVGSRSRYFCRASAQPAGRMSFCVLASIVAFAARDRKSGV